MNTIVPHHPGVILKEDVLNALGLTAAKAARELGVSTEMLMDVLDGRAPVTVDLALRLEAWLDGPSAESWVRGQITYDLYQARKDGQHIYKQIVSLNAAENTENTAPGTRAVNPVQQSAG